MGEVIKLFDEVALIKELKEDSVQLIHATSLVVAIKKLITAYDIFHLNIEICTRFKLDDPVWDLPSIIELKTIRRELIVYHRVDFEPTVLLDHYCDKLGIFFRGLKCSKGLRLR